MKRTSVLLLALFTCLALSAWGQGGEKKTLFEDDFNSGAWKPEWQSRMCCQWVQDGWLYTLDTDGWPRDSMAVVHDGDQNWRDYTLSLKAQFVENPNFGTIDNFTILVRTVNFVRSSEQHSGKAYQIIFNGIGWGPPDGPNTVKLIRSDYDIGSDTTLVTQDFPLSLDPMNLTITVNGPRIQLWIDDKKVFDVTDRDPFLYGGIGVHAIWETEARFDDVVVLPTNDPPAPVCSSLTDLGDFYLNVYESLGLSPQGSVVGTTLRWGQPYQGFEYKKGKFLQLPTLGGDSADPRQINARGQIAGQSQLLNGLWHATMWDQGKPIDLGTLGGGSSFAGSLNDRGDAAGNSAVLSLYDFHAAAWFKGTPVNLSLEGEIQSYANGINNRGQVTGITNYPDQTWHSFIWKDGARTELPRSAGNVFSSFINNAGTVCGGADFTRGFHAYIYNNKNVVGLDPTPKNLVDLDPTSQWWWSSCSGLNDKGHAVGVFGGAVGNRAFLWRNANKGMIDLNSTIPPDSRTSLFTAYNVNGADQITAAGYVDGQLHGFLLTPKMCSGRCAPAPKDMIGWWPGEGNAKDVIGGSTGVVEGVKFAPAAVQRGFVFDGVDDSIEVPDSAELHSITNQITVMAWINPQKPIAPDGSGDYWGYIFARRDPGISEGISLFIPPGGYLAANLETTNGGIWLATWNPIKFDGNWEHIAMTADTGTGRVAFYLEGELLFEDHPAGLLGSNFVDVTHLYFGQRQGNEIEGPYQSMHYRGMMDEIQLFNRSLDPSEIKTIYQAGQKGVCKK